MNKIYDCIVIGGGPSGSTAAYHLANKGINVLLIDKAVFPRYKPCGGGVCPGVAHWLDIDYKPTISHYVNKICTTWNLGMPIEGELGENTSLWMVRRETFDNYLLENAEKKGAKIQQNTSLLDIEDQGDYWLVKTDQGDYSARYVIGADGAKGISAKCLGFKDRKRIIAGALEVEIPLDKLEDETLYLEFGMVRNGYLWNFPKADGFSMGVEAFNSKDSKKLHSILDNYISGSGVDSKDSKKFGHPICFWDGKQKLHTKRAVLAGEAACVVDPLTAEGIRPSIISATLAANAVSDALEGNVNALSNYSEQIHEELGKEFIWAKRLAKLCYGFPKIYYNAVIKQPGALRTLGRHIAGEVKYSELVEKALKRLKIAGFIGK